MGLWSFFKGFFSSDDEELEALRAKHNIHAASGVKEGRASPKVERDVPDPWEEIDNYRMNFFLGSWATRRLRGLMKGEEKDKKKREKGRVD